MRSLVMMYVFYDRNGDIKAITPQLNTNLSNLFSVATFPLTTVEEFLTAQKNTFDYHVIVSEKIGRTTYRIAKKYTQVTHTRTLDNFLTKIGPIKNDSSIIVTNDIINKVIIITLNKNFKEMYESGIEEDREFIQQFFNISESSVYITEKNNPYFMLLNCKFTPKDLFNKEKLYFSHTGNYTNVSAYTRKIVEDYGYEIKE